MDERLSTTAETLDALQRSKGTLDNGGWWAMAAPERLQSAVKGGVPIRRYDALVVELNRSAARLAILETYSERHAGALPPPAMLREYSKIAGTMPQTIVDNWLGQSRHRRRMEWAGWVALPALRLAIAGGLALFFFSRAFDLVAAGTTWSGMVALSAELAAITTALILQQRRTAPVIRDGDSSKDGDEPSV